MGDNAILFGPMVFVWGISFFIFPILTGIITVFLLWVFILKVLGKLD